MNIKLIGLDLDRTTLNNQGKMAERTKKALEEAINKGVHVVIATGRSFHSMPEDVYDVKGIEFTANSNGAEIRKLKTGEVIYRNCVDEDIIETMRKYLEEKGNMIEVFTDGRAYISQKEYDDIRDFKKKFRARDYVMKTRVPVDDIYGFMEQHKDRIENINIFFESDEDKQRTFEELKEIKSITVTSSMPDNLEIGGLTTSKATALKYLADMFDIKREEIMCCGDSPNDGEMLKMAGVAVAVANAADIIKEIADYHTDSNDDCGVAKAVERFVLNKDEKKDNV